MGDRSALCMSRTGRIRHVWGMARRKCGMEDRDRSRPESYRPTALAFSVKLGVLRRSIVAGPAEMSQCILTCVAATRSAVTLSLAPGDVALGGSPPARLPHLQPTLCASVQFSGSAGPSPCPACLFCPVCREFAQVDFELLATI